MFQRQKEAGVGGVGLSGAGITGHSSIRAGEGTTQDQSSCYLQSMSDWGSVDCKSPRDLNNLGWKILRERNIKLLIRVGVQITVKKDNIYMSK